MKSLLSFLGENTGTKVGTFVTITEYNQAQELVHGGGVKCTFLAFFSNIDRAEATLEELVTGESAGGDMGVLGVGSGQQVTRCWSTGIRWGVGGRTTYLSPIAGGDEG